MRFGPGSTIDHAPQSPPGNPYPGVVNSSGHIVIDGKPYEYHEESDTYRYQDPGPPPGDWTTYKYDTNGDYEKVYYDRAFMVPIPVELGSWSAVA